MAKRKKTRRRVEPDAPAIQSWTGADEALAQIRKLDARIGEEETEKQKNIAEMERRHDRVLVPLVEQRDALGKALEEFTSFHRQDLGDSQSKRMNNGVLGFRRGQRALKTLSKWTLKKMLAKLEELGLTRFIKVKKSVDKAEILKAQAAGELDDQQLKQLGGKIEQKERFYYETPEQETVNPEAKESA